MPARIAALRTGVLLTTLLLPAMSVWAQCMQCQNCQANCSPCLGLDDTTFDGGYPNFAPATNFGCFDLNVRSGLIYGASGGFLKDRMEDPGVAIEVTFRQPLGGGGCCSRTFFEIGGYFSQVYGNNLDVSTSGTFTETPAGGAPMTTPLDDFLRTKLSHLRRDGVQLGIGHWCSPHILDCICLCNADLMWRGGLRLGSVHAQYDQNPSDVLQALIDAANAAGNPFQLAGDDDFAQGDNFLALYTSLGLELAPFRVPISCCRYVDGRLSVEGIYEHSWFELKNFTPNSKGLGTIGVQLGLSFAW